MPTSASEPPSRAECGTDRHAQQRHEEQKSKQQAPEATGQGAHAGHAAQLFGLGASSGPRARPRSLHRRAAAALPCGVAQADPARFGHRRASRIAKPSRSHPCLLVRGTTGRRSLRQPPATAITPRGRAWLWVEGTPAGRLATLRWRIEYELKDGSPRPARPPVRRRGPGGTRGRAVRPAPRRGVGPWGRVRGVRAVGQHGAHGVPGGDAHGARVGDPRRHGQQRPHAFLVRAPADPPVQTECRHDEQPVATLALGGRSQLWGQVVARAGSGRTRRWPARVPRTAAKTCGVTDQVELPVRAGGHHEQASPPRRRRLTFQIEVAGRQPVGVGPAAAKRRSHPAPAAPWWSPAAR